MPDVLYAEMPWALRASNDCCAPMAKDQQSILKKKKKGPNLWVRGGVKKSDPLAAIARRKIAP